MNTKSEIDPTANVLKLVEEAVKRLDDVSKLNKELQASEIKRLDQRIEWHVQSTDKLTTAEAKRIDALRAGDVAAVATANERATASASILANQVAASADIQRNLVATTATTVAAQLQLISTQLIERIAALEKAQYENKGKTGVTDPMLGDLVTEIRALNGFKSNTVGEKKGTNNMIGWIFAAIMAIATIVTLFIKLH